MSTIFKGLFDSATQETVSVDKFLICVASALVIGVLLAAAYGFKAKTSKSFLFTVAVLPAVVCVVIMMVNGNIGAGVAVAGAFSLVRFRSAPGNAKEIGTIFIAMGAGLIAGMGYIAYALLFAVIFAVIMLLFQLPSFFRGGEKCLNKTLKITVPEDLNFTGAFDDILEKYTECAEIVSVKTASMGSLYKLKYNIRMKKVSNEKDMIDELRCRNGNLEICLSVQEETENAL